METGISRIGLDKFYTKPSTVKQCLEYFNEHLEIHDSDIILEPCAGNGVFIDELMLLFPNIQILGYDLDPCHHLVVKQDFLSLELPDDILTKKIHVIGNPPFGIQSSLARKFIKKSCEFCDTVSFILPKSFKKNSYRKAFPLDFFLVFSEDLDDNSFSINGVEHDVPCIFQIWKRSHSSHRMIQLPQRPCGFNYVKKDESPHFSIRRVGFYAGVISRNPQEKNINSHYFIKLNDPVNITEFREMYIIRIRFENENTVGPRSISKYELTPKINSILSELFSLDIL